MMLVVRNEFDVEGSATYFFSVMHVRRKEIVHKELKNKYEGGATVCAFNMGDMTNPIMHSSMCADGDGYSRKFGMLNCIEKFLNQVARSSVRVAIVGYCTANEEIHVEVETFARDTSPYNRDESYNRLRRLASQRSRGNWVKDIPF